MRSLIAVAALLAPLGAYASTGAAAISWEARLSPELASCLKLRAPNFKIWSASEFYKGVLDYYTYTTRQTPSIVAGDFNGDAVDDVAVAGRDGDRSKVVAVFADVKKCSLVELTNRPFEDPATAKVDMGTESGYGLIDFLSSARKGAKSSPFEKSALDLKTDALVVNVFGKAATLYYSEKGVFKPYALAD